jgi:hypothetical protein
MKRRYLLGGFILLSAAIMATAVVRCEFPASTFTSFSYIPHERPRVFVLHHPIRALPGQNLTVQLVPSVRPEDGAIDKAVARLRRSGSDQYNEKTCDPNSDGTFTCVFPLPADDNTDYIYDGYLKLAGNKQVNPRASYRFTAATTLGSDRLVTLREPVVDVRNLPATYRMDTAWVRDSMRAFPTDEEQYSESQFISDIEIAVYDGILRDPVYRWRDDQLGFYVYSDPGFTTTYYSGFDTRCGQNPWPAESEFRSTLKDMETIGVLHRYSGKSALEGTVASEPPPTANTIRDCSGAAVKQEQIGTFSVRGGTAETASIAKHEFGHAAFSLGDEYPESEVTRRVAAAQLPIGIDSDCCCRTEDGTTTLDTATAPVSAAAAGAVGGGNSVFCIALGGGMRPALGGSAAQLLPCTAPSFRVSCGASPLAVCPWLSGQCIRPEMWLGQPPPANLSTARPNVFASKEVCEAGRTSASTHPGVEDAARGLDSCRELCGPDTTPCPCGEPEAWIVDKNPDVFVLPQFPVPPDSMASITASRDGSTCGWCVETSLCVRWQRARGDTSDAAWNYCKAPPQNAAELERQSITLARAIMEWIEELIRNWRF